MRSFILVVVTAFVLSVLALIYFWVQPRHGKAGSGKGVLASTRSVMHHTDPSSGIADGDHVSVKKYDQRTGELASEFISEEYTPRKGGLIDVKNAIARFYLAHGQIIELHGDTGTFRTDTPEETKRKSFSENRAGTPNRGQLKNVTVTILETIGDEAHHVTRPTMTIAMDNAAFDSENATIVTEAFIDPKTGKKVDAEWVPVTVRSPDTNPNGYDFDGYGMKMLWNERDHRLTSLDIVHGERLIIKNPKNVNGSKAQANNVAQSRLDQSHALPGIALASADPRAAIQIADATEAPAVPTRRRRRPTTATAPTEVKPAAPALPALPAPSTQSAARAPRRRPPYVQQPPTIQKFTPNVEPPIYRAEFHEDVVIMQNDAVMATADRMFVDFWMKSGGDDAPASTQPGAATQPGGRHAHAGTRPATDVAVTQPTTQLWNHLRNTDATTQPFTAPVAFAGTPTTAPASTKPTTRTADEAPIYIYWNGPLHVAPHSEVALIEHTSIVTLEGAPVVATQQTSQIRASRLVYRTEDGSLRGASMPGSEVTLISTDAQKGKSTIHTTGLEYFKESIPPTAILSGPSNALLPTEANGAVMNAQWDRRCVLQFTDSGNAIKEADLTGDVHVDHPQMKLDSQRLELSFAEPPAKSAPRPVTPATTTPSTKPAAQMDLKQLVASSAVHCVMTGNDGKLTTIDGDRLTLLTENGPDNKLTPRTVNVDGKAHTINEDQDLTADHLAITLAPSTRPAATKPSATQAQARAPATTQSSPMGGAVDLESLIAQGNVHTTDKKNNTQAFADTMLIDKKLGKTNVKLVGGQPGAKVLDKTSTVVGPIIDIASEEQTLAVDGGGEMIGSQQDQAGGAAKPMHVTWMRNMRIDGRQNIVNAYGDVHAKTTEADGTVRIVSGEQAKLLLVDVPTTQPSTKPATRAAIATTGPATKPTSRPGSTDEPMAKKAIRQAIFTENAKVDSQLSDPDGLPIQRMTLRAAMLQYDVLPPANGVLLPGQEPNKRITVPVPGKMLTEDYRPSASTTQPDSGAAGGMSSRGATAFQWDKSLVYDDETRRATMIGSVVIDHRDDVAKDDTMHITGETVIADMEPALPPTPKTAATGPTTRAATTQPRVKNVVVRDHVHVTMKTGVLVADWIEYSPITRVLIAHGTPEADAVFTRTIIGDLTTQKVKSSAQLGGTQPIRAQQMQWDAGADLPKITQGNATFRR